MPLIGVRAKVENSDKWREEFKTHSELFKSQGVSMVYMGSTENNSVLAIFNTNDLDRFEKNPLKRILNYILTSKTLSSYSCAYF